MPSQRTLSKHQNLTASLSSTLFIFLQFLYNSLGLPKGPFLQTPKTLQNPRHPQHPKNPWSPPFLFFFFFSSFVLALPFLLLLDFHAPNNLAAPFFSTPNLPPQLFLVWIWLSLLSFLYLIFQSSSRLRLFPCLTWPSCPKVSELFTSPIFLAPQILFYLDFMPHNTRSPKSSRLPLILHLLSLFLWIHAPTLGAPPYGFHFLPLSLLLLDGSLIFLFLPSLALFLFK